MTRRPSVYYSVETDANGRTRTLPVSLSGDLYSFLYNVATAYGMELEQLLVTGALAAIVHRASALGDFLVASAAADYGEDYCKRQDMPIAALLSLGTRTPIVVDKSGRVVRWTNADRVTRTGGDRQVKVANRTPPE